MKQLVSISSPRLPALVAAAGERASMRFLEFFAANIRNPHTRRAYYRAAEEFLAWCASVGVPSVAAVQPMHVATWTAGLSGLIRIHPGTPIPQISARLGRRGDMVGTRARSACK
jgi:hypothetical protein